MLPGFVDLKGHIYCESMEGALADLITGLLVMGNPAVRLVARPEGEEPTEASVQVFERLRSLLIAAVWLDPTAPVGKDPQGASTLLVPNPHAGLAEVPRRIRLAGMDAAAAVLRAFTVLRIRFQPGVNTTAPQVRLEASMAAPETIDALYLIGDAFTERYPVRADLRRDGMRFVLDLIGEPAPVGTGLRWPKGDYVRCRDAALLLRPLLEAVTGPARALVIPRRSSVGDRVRVRFPVAAGALSRLAWLSNHQDLKQVPEGDPVGEAGSDGEHFALAPDHSGALLPVGPDGAGSLVPVRVSPPARVQEIEPEQDGRLSVWFEGLGGVREIGANAYYYRFGRRGLLFDAGVDANRDGWLGVPALERVGPLDAIVLTHAHLDHVGAVPLLLATFPGVPVYCTRATYELLAPTLDGSRQAWEEQKARGELPAMTDGLANRINPTRFRLTEFGRPTAVPEIPGLTLTFSNACHMIGAVYTDLRFGDMTIAHTGDISLLDLVTQPGLDLTEKGADHVVMEGTYGYNQASNRAGRKTAADQLLEAIDARTAAGGVVLIPSFTLGRAQELVALLSAWNARTGRRVPIRTVGMINRVHELIRARLTEFLPGFTPDTFRDVLPLSLQRYEDEQAQRQGDVEELRKLATDGPCVIVASHGMMAENTGSYRLGRAILTSGDPRHAIFLCGYMDPRTPGFRLSHQFTCEVIDYGPGDRIARTVPPGSVGRYSMSSHASFEELVEVADRVPRQNLLLMHGEGDGLDNLKAHLEERYRQAGRSVQVFAPGLGERVLFGEVAAPPGWDEEIGARPSVEEIAPGRPSDWSSGFRVRGLTLDGSRATALIPVGRQEVVLTLESERIAPERVRRLVLRAGAMVHADVVLYDRDKGRGDWRRFALRSPGVWRLRLSVLDPGGAVAEPSLLVYAGNELRLRRAELDVGRPVLEIDVGGELEASVEGLQADDWGAVAIRHVDWIAEERLLRIELEPLGRVGSLRRVMPAIRWSNRYVQSGPSLGDLSFEPQIRFQPAPARVGRLVELAVSSSPPPAEVRLGGQSIAGETGVLAWTPTRPGPAELWLGYPGLGGGTEWRWAGTLEVQPVGRVHLPSWALRGREWTVRAWVGEEYHGQAVSLLLDGIVLESWTANSAERVVTIRVDEVRERATVTLRMEGTGWILWEGAVEVLAGLTLDTRASFPVTTADGSLCADLAWAGLREVDRPGLEAGFTEAGFEVRGWQGDVLRIVGQAGTAGRRIVHVPGVTASVSVWTLHSLNVQLDRPGPHQPGQVLRMAVGGEALDDEIPLHWDIDRVAPLLDGLSARVEGNQVELLPPGSYAVALKGGDRRLAEVIAVVSFPSPLVLAGTSPLRQSLDRREEDAIGRLENLSADQPVLALVRPGSLYQVAQGPGPELEEIGWRWLGEASRRNESMLVCSTGLALPALAGAWLARLREQNADGAFAHLSYPAPRRELASSAAEARRLRKHRVLCCLPRGTTIDRGDEYRCPRCRARPLLRTDQQSVWLACPSCEYGDRRTILTLNAFRAAAVQVLFAEYRIARYLTSGLGVRYGGAFARMVFCQACHRPQTAYARPGPWDAAELTRLLEALSGVWDEDAPTRSIRRAVDRAGRQIGHPSPAAQARVEDALRRLVDAGVMVDGRPHRTIDRLARGTSLCCDAPLLSWRRPVSRLFVGVEQLFGAGPAAMRHPGLLPGRPGLRALLTVADS